jgi:hypothetical protein
MSLSTIFRSARIARFKPDKLLHLLSALKFPRLSAPTRGSRSPEAFPALACGVLFLTLLLQLVLPSEAALPEDSGLAPRMPPLAGELPQLNYPAIMARPPFAPDRKPLATGGAQAGLNGYEVLGIAISAEKATVVVRGPGGKTQRVLYGAELMGWKLASVDRAQVVFERGDEKRTLALRRRQVAAAPRPMRSAQVRAAGDGSRADSYDHGTEDETETDE